MNDREPGERRPSPGRNADDPTEARVVEVCRSRFDTAPDTVERLATGLCNRVYRVRYGAESFVVRVSPYAETLAGSSYWLKTLEKTGVTIPRVLHADLESGEPAVIMTCLEGSDLGRVFDTLAPEERRAIAREIARANAKLRRLPEAKGFGFLSSYDDPAAKKDWKSVVVAHMERSRGRIAANGYFDPAYADRVESFLPRFEDYFRRVRPLPFFDDATTKNVMVSGGAFVGIVDLDWICFGDDLYAIALTRMSLLDSGRDDDYVDCWIEERGVTGAERAALEYYTLVFCLDFMSEKGTRFNEAEAAPVSAGEVRALEKRFATLERNAAQAAPA